MFKILKDLQKQAIDLFKNFESRFLESNSFNVLKEKYQSLNLRQQRLIKYALIVFLLLFIMYLPVSYLGSSIGSWSDFKQKYVLSLDLLKTRANKASFLNLSEEDLNLKINQIVKKYSSDEFSLIALNKPFPKAKSVSQREFNIELKHLNIKQAIRLGTELNNLPQARLSEISFLESKEYKKHYDVAFKLSAFVSKKMKGASSAIKRRPVKKRTDFLDQKQSDEIQPTEKKQKRKTRKRKIREVQ